MTMQDAYATAYTLAATTREPAVIVRRGPDDFDALSAEDYRRAPAVGAFFDALAPEED